MTEQLPKELAVIIAFCLFGLTVLMILLLWIRNGRTFLHDLKGEKWESHEVVILIWMPLFVSMVLADVYLGMHASDPVWYSMDIIMFMALGKSTTTQILTRTKPDKDEKATD